jgi:hypothetical protein
MKSPGFSTHRKNLYKTLLYLLKETRDKPI